MFPTLFEIGPFPVRSYGLLIAISFAIGIWWGRARAEKRGMDGLVFTDLVVAILIASVLGARLAYVIPFWSEYAGDPLRVFKLWEGGLTLYGGIFGAIAGSIVFCAWKKVSFWLAADICAPLVALGIGITRVGCFLNGCCFGVPTSFWTGTIFPATCAAGREYPGMPIHPSQLYDAAFGLALTGVLVLVEPKLKGRGQLWMLFIVLYGANRYLQDLLRYFDPETTLRIAGQTFSGTQLVSLAMVVVGLVLFFVRGRSRAQAR